jgi:hypothetical protein
MRTTKPFYRLAWLMLALTACSQTLDPLSGGSESHFLTCEQDDECDSLGSQFQCIAGHCQEQAPSEGAPSNEDDEGDVNLAGSGGMAANNGGAGGVSGAGAANVGGAPSAQAGSGGPSTPSVMPGGDCGDANAYDPLVPVDGETCYELHAHGGAGTGDPFIVPDEESISQLYYDIPWPADSVATRFGADFDNVSVLVQWLLFSTNSGSAGAIERNVVGTVLGEHAKVLGAWNIGGCNVTLPTDVGLELPDPQSGKKLMVQWHHRNYTGEPRPDSSTVQVCTVPRSARANIGGITLLGTEELGAATGMPPDTESRFNGTCLNATSEPITIVGFRPNMHEIGTNMYSEITRAGGGIDVVFDQPFVFDNQVHYLSDPTVVLQPGDKILSECTYFNNTPTHVQFGLSTRQEVCFQYVFSYPAGALDKPGNLSLLGPENTCWGDD